MVYSGAVPRASVVHGMAVTVRTQVYSSYISSVVIHCTLYTEYTPENPHRVSFHAMMEKQIKQFHSVYGYKIKTFFTAANATFMPKIYDIH